MFAIFEPFTVTLIAGTNLDIGKVYHIKNKGTGTITVSSTETIDDELTQELYQHDSMMIFWNGTDWRII